MLVSKWQYWHFIGYTATFQELLRIMLVSLLLYSNCDFQALNCNRISDSPNSNLRQSRYSLSGRNVERLATFEDPRSVSSLSSMEFRNLKCVKDPNNFKYLGLINYQALKSSHFSFNGQSQPIFYSFLKKKFFYLFEWPRKRSKKQSTSNKFM